MHAAHDLARAKQTRNRLPVRADDLGFGVDLQTAHAVVDDGRDEGHIKRLVGELRSGD